MHISGTTAKKYVLQGFKANGISVMKIRRKSLLVKSGLAIAGIVVAGIEIVGLSWVYAFSLL